MTDARGVLGRLRRALRRKRSSSRGGAGAQAGNADNSVTSPFVASQISDISGNAGPNTITRTQMQDTADDQSASAFFSRLPLEIRRLIYLEVWCDYLQSHPTSTDHVKPDLRLHIYTDGLKQGAFRHTRCKIRSGTPAQEDVQVIQPWPFDSSHKHTPPMWFWFAWVMRLHWDKHWKCQHAIMKRWDPRTGSAWEPESSPFLPVFLTCKKMYWEAIVSLFHHVTLVFTSSEDSYRFFIQNQHPFVDGIRSLEFSFTNPNDHLFLAQVQREVPDCSAAGEPSMPSPGASTVISPRIEVFGSKLWSELVQGLRTATPDLRDLDVTIGGRLPRSVVLAMFGGPTEDGETQDGRADEEDAPVWKLPGKLDVFFKIDNQRYAQDKARVVRR